jgi:cytoskeletal protein CcmA (bactofilin family)
MFSKKPAPLLQHQKVAFKSVLDAGCIIQGQLEFSGNYHIIGKVLGDIVDLDNTGAILWINKNARVKGNVICSNLVLAGTLEGGVVASGAVEICSGATIIGDIQADRLYVDSNAKINGRLDCLNGHELEEVLKTLEANESLQTSENS